MPESILIVENDPSARDGLLRLINSWGFKVDVAIDGEEALRKVFICPPAIVLSESVMPRMNGIELLKSIKQQNPSVAVIFLTAHGSIENAVEAIKYGADDYFISSIDPQRLRNSIDQILDRRRTLGHMESLKQRSSYQGGMDSMIGLSPEMQQVFDLIEQAGPTNASVLITGEPGTGKELVARAIHRASPRKNSPFVMVNCAAILDTHMESELFGHEGGALSDAPALRQGYFDLADCGTLFLDAVDEMASVTQAKLLHALRERRFRPVGGTEEKTINTRVIAATKQVTHSGGLRADLFYWLNVIGIHLPPLRDREHDIPLLVDAFIREFAVANRKAVAGADKSAMDWLKRHHWPGNVSELRSVIERGVIIARDPLLTWEDIRGLEVRPKPMPLVGLAPGMTVNEVEHKLIDVTLAYTGGNKTKAATLLGISIKTLHNKLAAAKSNQQ